VLGSVRHPGDERAKQRCEADPSGQSERERADDEDVPLREHQKRECSDEAPEQPRLRSFADHVGPLGRPRFISHRLGVRRDTRRNVRLRRATGQRGSNVPRSSAVSMTCPSAAVRKSAFVDPRSRASSVSSASNSNTYVCSRSGGFGPP